MDDLPAVAALLARVAPSCGPVRLIAVDGHAGSGKSTFAGRLATVLGGAPVLHLDDIATHEEPFAWLPRLSEQVIGPLSLGRDARYTSYDWTRRRFRAPRVLEAAPVVVLEGVGAGRAGLRSRLAALLWMERDAGASWERGRRRDGPGLTAFWDGWIAAERNHFARDPSRPFADALVREGQSGYEVTHVPAGALAKAARAPSARPGRYSA
jgi:uridine kinase